MPHSAPSLKPRFGDALLVVDVQNDFLPGGTLAVDRGNEVVAVLNAYMEAFDSRGLPVVLTRDWHPPDHCSFKAHGGPWPVHCVAHSRGADFPAALDVEHGLMTISKATAPESEAYSAFSGTPLAERLRALEVDRVFVGGLATDYCVKETVKDALAAGFRTVLLTDAVRAVEPETGHAALEEMCARGAQRGTLQDIVERRTVQ